MDRKEHWGNIYKTKRMTEVSWYEPMPETSLEFIRALDLEKDAKIIDIGGGDSFLTDFLLMEGYTNLSVLDISEEALERVKRRLGERAQEVNWIVSDVCDFNPEGTFDVWHDRAAFHFLTQQDDIQNYLDTLKSTLRPGGYSIIGTFSEKGPEKCSGIAIKQYSLEQLNNLLSGDFNRLASRSTCHKTPSGNEQNFSFCSFQRKASEEKEL